MFVTRLARPICSSFGFYFQAGHSFQDDCTVGIYGGLFELCYHLFQVDVIC